MPTVLPPPALPPHVPPWQTPLWHWSGAAHAAPLASLATQLVPLHHEEALQLGSDEHEVKQAEPLQA
jgi:hypothetical protein